MNSSERKVNSLDDRFDINWNPLSRFYDRHDPKYRKIKIEGEMNASNNSV